MPADDVRQFFESADAEPSAQFSEALLERLRAGYLRARPDAFGDAGRPTHQEEEGTILIDVLHEALPWGRGRDLERPREGRSRRRIAVASAAAALVVILVVAGTLLAQQTGDDHLRTRPAAPVTDSTAVPTTPPIETPPPTLPGDASTTGALLPEGTPSTPHTGELVAALSTNRVLGPIDRLSLYADGRLVWAFYDPSGADPSSAQANTMTAAETSTAQAIGSGWSERRLTPEGVERVRAVFLATGLFDAAASPSGLLSCTMGNRLCVRDDSGRLRAHELPEGTAPQAEELVALVRSLPATEWADQQPKPYVASRIAVCLRRYSDQVQLPTELSVLLPRFPARVAELLAGRESSALPLGGDPYDFTNVRCFELTLAEARAMEGALLDPSVGGSHEFHGIALRFTQPLEPTQPDSAYVFFRALLPDGLLPG